MPVHIEWIDSPSAQDWLDLNKLYKDAPVEWFDSASPKDAQGYVKHKQQQGYQLVAGRFNDRLIAAATLQVQDSEHCYLLEQLCVRGITRNRGVARQLLVRLCQWSDEQKCSLLVNDQDAQFKTLLEFGFVHGQGVWKRQR